MNCNNYASIPFSVVIIMIIIANGEITQFVSKLSEF